MKKREPSAYFFDLDGTLIDTEQLYVKAIILALRQEGIHFDQTQMMQLVFGRSWTDIQNDLVSRFPQHTFEDLTVRVREQFRRQSDATDVRIPGSIELLKRLTLTHPVAIVSGSPRQEIEDAIEMMGVAGLIQFYLGAEDYSPGKPHPNCYLLAARKLSIFPEECLVFEDSVPGVLAAKRAGMKCVALDRAGLSPADLSAADEILKDLAHFQAENLF